ncbi:MAG TPA: radical SAM protein [Acidisoma sp.]|uniref:B12-binding domain-containing radical SAM protein n=1 Tax=Acidisoma sp. TaxID=1872115 RepID=UPI002C764B31|nr:radical SAM protein [Acidisoma sp.]HTH99315.1 radical SAM protein [Acidisoma sp.]
MTATGPARFHVALIKPSHYDDDGYVIQWFRSSMPSNSLAAVYGLAVDCAERRVLGEGVEITVTVYDETNTRIRPERIAADIRAAGSGLVGLVGVQSNQFPRAMDLARRLRALRLQVVIGGFHVSGSLSMLPGVSPELQAAMDLGITLYAGEAEDGLEELLRDAHAGRLRSLYNHMANLPNIAGVPIPRLPRDRIARTAGHMTTFDAGRGCPFQCSFCTIINVQGRVSRRRSAEDVEQIIRHNLAQGITSFFITDDNFARNKDWEPILDRLIKLREEEGCRIKLTIQVDTLCHRIPHFIEKCGRAGVVRVFIGLESINPESLAAAKKKQNRITEYRDMLLAWKRIRAVIWAGYIIGFPADTRETVLRDIGIIQRELAIDFLEFFILTPLPGSEDHQTLAAAGVPMDGDLNRYDTFHAVTDHPVLSRAAWEAVYWEAWSRYYTFEHMVTLMRRAAATRISLGKMLNMLVAFWSLALVEHTHPLEGGYFRRRVRTERRPGLPTVPAWRFWPGEAAVFASRHVRIARMVLRLMLVRRRLKRDPTARDWRDLALTPVADETGTLALLTATEAARTAATRPMRPLAASG